MSEIPIGVGKVIIHNGAHEETPCVLITTADKVTPPGTEAKKFDKIWLDDPSVLACLKIYDPAGSFVLMEALVLAITEARGEDHLDADRAMQAEYMRVIDDNMGLKKDLTEALKPKVCRWTRQVMTGINRYTPECGLSVQMTGSRYCPRCGGKVEVV